jgi:hypothetical protein
MISQKEKDYVLVIGPSHARGNDPAGMPCAASPAGQAA